MLMHMQIHYLEQPCSDYVRMAVQAAADIHREDMPGDILIFVTGVHLCISSPTKQDISASPEPLLPIHQPASSDPILHDFACL